MNALSTVQDAAASGESANLRSVPVSKGLKVMMLVTALDLELRGMQRMRSNFVCFGCGAPR